ncbi:MAG TPA: hypothetical protein VG982_00125 [Candidatus Paceibacterota bacterium]|jgi:hypothetical protein|nr:hypothetical protein [Candidatus Paceibacterota bacterium]
MKKVMRHLSVIVITLFLSCLSLSSYTTLIHAQTVLPDCIKNQPTLKATSDPNKYQYQDDAYGLTTISLSNNRFSSTPNGSNVSINGTWKCQSNGDVALTPDKQNALTPGAVTPVTSTPTPSVPQTSSNGDFQLKIKLNNPLKVNSIQDAIQLFMDAVVKIAIPFIVVFFIWAGFRFILARGNKEELKKAKAMFWNTLIGTLLILGAWAITDAIVGTINSIAN